MSNNRKRKPKPRSISGVALTTLLYKEIKRFLRIWPQTILPPAVTTSLYFLIFGTLIGNRIGEVNGLSYMDFIVPGVVLMSVITSAYSNVVSSFFSTKFQRNIEELIVSPVPNWVIIAGYCGGGVVRSAIVGTVILLIANVFTHITIHHWGITVSIFLLTAMTFSLAGFINATFAKTFDDIAIVPNFVLTPLSYLGGVFYSIQMLPEFWQKVSLVNPIFYMINAFRYGVVGNSDIDIPTTFIMLSGLVVVLACFSLWLLHKGIGIRS
ncbi:MAG TPA: ABC transporter permease [Crenotrichaceae bacterium]|nr:ABC transporter permease [Crenotrichaceae bacterium]